MKTYFKIGLILILLFLTGCVKTSEGCFSNEPKTLEEYKRQIGTWEIRDNKADCKIYPRNNELLCRFGNFGKIVITPTSVERLEGSCESGIKYGSGRPDIEVIHKKTIKGQKIFESISDDPLPREGWTWCSKDEKFVMGVEADNGQIQKYFDEFYRC